MQRPTADLAVMGKGHRPPRAVTARRRGRSSRRSGISGSDEDDIFEAAGFMATGSVCRRSGERPSADSSQVLRFSAHPLCDAFEHKR